MLNLLEEMVAERAKAAGIDRSDSRFTRREVRDRTGWTDFPVRTHLDKLVALEYVIVHRGGPGQRFVYELLYDGEGEGGRPFLMGLIDVEGLGDDRKHDYDSSREGRLMPARCPSEPRVRSAATYAATAASDRALRQSEPAEAQNALLGARTPSCIGTTQATWAMWEP